MAGNPADRKPLPLAENGQPVRSARTDLVYDAIVVGSGFGGAMAARELVRSGFSLLMLERGDWVQRGPHNWLQENVMELTPHYSMESAYRVHGEGEPSVVGAYNCVGGPSVFYGAVSFRLRERDFQPDPEIAGDSGSLWPYGYSALEPFYTRAERILGVAGEAGSDPTDPPRSGSYPQRPRDLAPVSRRIARAADELGLRPFPLPLSINNGAGFATGEVNDGDGHPGGHHGRRACVGCTTCDCFACAIGAKNDVASAVIPGLLAGGMTLRPNTVVVRLASAGRRVTSVQCRDRITGEALEFRARLFILAAGALASPHLVLASDLAPLNPAERHVGRYLMRHCNAMVYGVFARPPNPESVFQKQLGIHDFYFGDPDSAFPASKLGGIQQVHAPPDGLVRARLPGFLATLLSPGVRLMTGLLVIAEDQPQYENHVALNPAIQDAFGLPQLAVWHRYSDRDLAARGTLVRRARQVLRKAGAMVTYAHDLRTFSHAVGTLRAGPDAAVSPLDPDCRFRGVENLYVTDGSFMPTSGGVNPSLTIAANALRAGARIAQVAGAPAGTGQAGAGIRG